MFFEQGHSDFFRPFISKYREQIAQCLQSFYAVLYTGSTDYDGLNSRDKLIECFQETITRTPIMSDSDDDSSPYRSDREQANWILNTLIEYGWLEKQVDEATLQSSYAFTRIGRVFTQAMVESSGAAFRTRHRNTRNVRNALKAFVDQGDVYDLLDAYEYSERIISDFSDTIAELDERKRQLVQEVESQQLVEKASAEFFEFMEKRFMPDLAIRLSADSVEKWRDEIQESINKARRKRNDFKAEAENLLRKIAPELQTATQSSVYLSILTKIEQRIHRASEIMLPALRQALHGFTRRADIIMRQLSFASHGAQNNLTEICQKLSQRSQNQIEQSLKRAGEQLAQLSIGFYDPQQVKLHQRAIKRVVDSRAESSQSLNQETRKEIFVRQAVERAFALSNQDLSDHILKSMASGKKVMSHEIPVTSARELLFKAHAIEVGSAGRQSSEFQFKVEQTGRRVSDDYFYSDEFSIELVEKLDD